MKNKNILLLLESHVDKIVLAVYVLVGLFFGYLFGSIYSLTGLVLKRFSRQTQIPFAPFLLLGTYVAMFWGSQIVDWYFAML